MEVGVTKRSGAARDTETRLTTWARAATGQLLGLPDVHRVGIALVEGAGRQLRFTSNDRLAPPPGDAQPDEHAAWCLIDAYDDVPLTRVVRTGEVVAGTLDALGTVYEGFVGHLRTTRTQALAAVPLVLDGTTVGGVVLYFERPRSFDGDDGEEHLAALRVVGADIGAALGRALGSRASITGFTEAGVPPDARAAVHDVARTHAAVGDARSFLTRTLAGWGVPAEPSEDAVLCLSELVTNALVHSDTGCSVRAVLGSGTIHVAVRGGGEHHAVPVTSPEDAMRVHGRGLQIVDALATEWGSESSADGTTVWFSIALGR